MRLLLFLLLLPTIAFADSILVSPLSSQDRAKVLAEKIAENNALGMTQLKASLEESFRMVWYPSNGLTPQDVMDAYGNRAYLLFQASSIMQTAIAQVDPTFVPLVPPYEFTINQDGTVTIGEAI